MSPETSRRISGPAIAAACFAILLGPACRGAGPGTRCDPAARTSGMERVAEEDLAIFFDAPSDPITEAAREDFLRYVGLLWGANGLQVASSAPDFSTPYTIWFSTSQQALEAAGIRENPGLVMKRVKKDGSSVFVIHAADAAGLAFGVYAFLEEIGARFFHPKEELVPRHGGIYLPLGLEVARKPAFPTRGIHLHLLHPTEYFRAFNEPGAKNIDDAKEFVDWLVKTGQNHLQWSLLETVDFEPWKPHAAALIEYARGRGLKAGCEIHLWKGASLQNAVALVSSEEGWQAQMEASLDPLLSLGWDLVEINLGEFLSNDPAFTVEMLDHATQYVISKSPRTEVSVVNHVGNYPDLWVKYGGETVFFYHLPKYADTRLTNNLHTVFFFDLFRDWGGYGHENFFLQRDFLFEQLAKRKVRYKPESAYWCAADIDVPVFLPEYIQSRWIDIQGIAAETRKRGLPSLDGHVMFSSGHEWGYWMTDYLAAKMMWEPERELRRFIDHYAGAYGGCSGEAAGALSDLIGLQSEYLFDRRLVPFVSGEDIYDDLGYGAGITTHPKRVQFEELTGMDAADLARFEAEKVGGVEEMAGKAAGIEKRIAALCGAVEGSDVEGWCSELLDGSKIFRLRAEHSLRLYRAVIDKIRGGGRHGSLLAQAEEIATEAEKVIRNREAHYRFDRETLAGAYENPTIYPFGYLRQASTLCFWKRQQQQARHVIEHGVKASASKILTCVAGE